LPVLEKLKLSYLLWHEYILTFPKSSRYTLGGTVDKYLLQTIEGILVASFLQKQDKEPYIKKAIISLDTVKFLLLIAWESKYLETKKYIAISLHLETAGKMLGGWHGQVTKQNSPAKAEEK